MRALKLLVIFAIALGIVLFAFRPRQPKVMSYGDVRKQAFAGADHIRPRGNPPARPANLDTRLPTPQARACAPSPHPPRKTATPSRTATSRSSRASGPSWRP